MLKSMHPYHIVDQSPWPIFSAISALGMATGLVNMFHSKTKILLLISTMTMLILMYQWWRDVTRESTYQGKHTLMVSKGIKLGMIIFIFSEIMLFFTFFWTYFHSSLSPNMEIGMMWPPAGMKIFNPMEIPLLNTIILVSSGVTITWAHQSIMNKKKDSLMALYLTITLGISFTMLQTMEYWIAPFNLTDSIFGSIFFITTGMHGMHVIVGTIFMIICTMRMKINHLTKWHHTGMELMIWYWHFVDIVWLILYMLFYWWPN